MWAHPPLSAALSKELIRDAPCGFLSADETGKIIYANETLLHWLGYDEGDHPPSFTLHDIFDKPSALYFDAHLSAMLHMQNFLREISCQLASRDDGVSLPVLMNARLREDSDGKFVRTDFVFFNATERLQFEKTLRNARAEAEELAAIVKNATIGIIRVDAKGGLKRWNATAAALFDDKAPPAVGMKLCERMKLADIQNDWFATAISEVDQGGEHRLEVENDDGVYLNISVAEIMNTEDPFAVPDYSVIVRDVTARIQNDKRLSRMVQELNHRVKNTFAIVSALIRQSVRNPALSEDRQKLIDRLQSVAASHNVLTSNHWQNVDISELLKPLLAQMNDTSRFDCAGPKVALSSVRFKGLSMAFHELMTNALKYGALSNDHGSVTVRWALSGPEEHQLELSWVERGGPPVSVPENRGFGTLMLQDMLAMEFDGTSEITFPPEGLQFRFKGAVT